MRRFEVEPNIQCKISAYYLTYINITLKYDMIRFEGRGITAIGFEGSVWLDQYSKNVSIALGLGKLMQSLFTAPARKQAAGIQALVPDGDRITVTD
jgi:hypothetical protein